MPKGTKAQHECDLLALEIEQQRGEWLRTLDVQTWACDIFHAMKQGILASHLTRPEQGDLINNLRRLGQRVPIRENVGTPDETVSHLDDTEDAAELTPRPK